MHKYLLIIAIVLIGVGCSAQPEEAVNPAELTYVEVVMPKIDFAAEIPEQWEESEFTADTKGPADYHEFIVPPRKDRTNDRVVGTLGFRVVPRIADNDLAQELEGLKPFIQDSAGSEGVFAPVVETAMAGEPALQMRWQGMTKNEVEEVWYYTFAFVGDNLLVGYFFDEVADAELLKPVYDHAVQTVEKR